MASLSRKRYFDDAEDKLEKKERAFMSKKQKFDDLLHQMAFAGMTKRVEEKPSKKRKRAVEDEECLSCPPLKK